MSTFDPSEMFDRIQQSMDDERTARVVREQEERAHLADLAKAWAAGEITPRQLCDLQMQHKVLSGSGFSRRWDDVIQVSTGELAAWRRTFPDAPNAGDHWMGVECQPQPELRNTPVVYMLLVEGEVVYVGSTGCMAKRLKGHRGGKHSSCSPRRASVSP